MHILYASGFTDNLVLVVPLSISVTLIQPVVVIITSPHCSVLFLRLLF